MITPEQALLAVSLPPFVESPLVTIAIPTYNRLELLKEAVETALSQRTAVTYEVIVVDNGSDNIVRDWVESRATGEPRLGYYRNKVNLGMVNNWNQCILLARGHFVSILHDDDLLRDNFLSGFESVHEAKDIAYACRVIVGETAPHLWPKLERKKIIKPGHLLLGSLTPFPGVVFPRGASMKIGGFDPSTYPCSDYDFWVRLVGVVLTIRGGATSAFYRTSAQQASTNITSQLIDGSLPVRIRALSSTRVPIWLGMLFVAYAQNLLRRFYSASEQRKKSSLWRRSWDRLVSALWTALVNLLSRK